MIINIVALFTIISVNKKKQEVSFSERPHFHEFVMKDLNLTENQKDTFFKLRHDFMMKGKLHLDKIKMYRDSVFIEIMKYHPDTNLINTFNHKILQQQTDLMKLSYEHFLLVKQVLDSAQQQMYFRFLYKKMQGMPPYFHKGKCNKSFPPPPFINEIF